MSVLYRFHFYFTAVLTAALCIFLTITTENVAENVKHSLEVCLSVIIPSLFSFMVLSLFMLKSGVSRIVTKPLYLISKHWFKFGETIFSIFIISLFGGYPTGVKLLKEYSSIYPNNMTAATKALSFCYCGNPSFIITIIGLQVFGSVHIGFLIYLSNVLASISICIFVNIREKKQIVTFSENSYIAKTSFSTLASCIKDTLTALSIICGTIISFNVILELIVKYIPDNNIVLYIKSITEISNASSFVSSNNLIPFFSALTSFGGLCILVQTVALSENKFSLKLFFMLRIPAALLSMAFSSLLIFFFNPVSEAAAYSGETRLVLSEYSPICSICLIMMVYILLKWQKQNEKNTGKTKQDVI